MRRSIPTYRQALTGIFITLAVAGALLWLMDGGVKTVGIPIFFIGLIGFVSHDVIPLAWRTRHGLARRIGRIQGHHPRLARELVWQEYGRELSDIGIYYQQYFKFYPRWIQRRNDYYVPMMVSDASAFSDHRVRIILNGREYLFSFADTGIDEMEPPHHERGLLELFSNNEKVLGLHMVEEQSELGPYWKVVGLGTFVDGPWRGDFQKLHEKIKRDIEDRIGLPIKPGSPTTGR